MTDSGAKVITVGISPCWDITCRGSGLAWGDHAKLDSQHKRAAGKALNVSRALCWMGIESTAAGLWGTEDYDVMLADLVRLKGNVDVSMARAPGRTRENITIIDTQNQREMHLRAPSRLANEQTLTALHDELNLLVHPGAICVFSGSMPCEEELLEQIIEMIVMCSARGGYAVVDTSGQPLRIIADAGGIELLKPNLNELSQLCGKEISEDADPMQIIESARTLLKKANAVLVSIGQRGAILVGPESSIAATAQVEPEDAAAGPGSVGCGDYLLAGFLAGKLRALTNDECLGLAMTAAAGRYFGWAEDLDFQTCKSRVEVTCREIL